MHKHASTAQIDAVAESDPDQPVVMLNLLRYRETAESGYGVDGMSGEAAYREYGRRFAELHPRFGGEPIWMGRAGHTAIGPTSEQWDIAILVRYPTRAQFVAMFRDPDYLAIAPIRAAALEDSRIIETTQLLPRV
ncbi:DUF1330 domain-containing protein [Candidatus Poriferisodalis sp.]|uniref:DUF1330 domain-containing protein n=1 Tax=Candidatus Poriferisodalis sp. TaxID=3101277 RepID=UPI003B5C2081